MRLLLILLMPMLLVAGYGPSADSSDQAFSPQQEDAIALAKEQYPELKDIGKRPPNIIGWNTDIIVQDRAGGWNIVFVKGWGDCPSGCIHHHYWYVSVEENGDVKLEGEYVTDNSQYRGKPLWGIPRQ